MIRQDEDNPAPLASEGLLALLYGDVHPYGRARAAASTASSGSAARRCRHSTPRGSGPARCRWSWSATSSRRAPSSRRAALSRHGTAGPPARLRCFHRLPAARERRVRVIPMMNKAQADIAYGFTSIAAIRPGVLRVLADEQHPRRVLDRRPAGRQHPRAAGHGVLRVQRARRERRSRDRC